MEFLGIVLQEAELPEAKVSLLEKRFEEMKKAHETELVQEAARQVRTLAANWTDTSNPEQLVAPIESLARIARQYGDKEANLYSDLAMTARKFNNMDIDIGMLVLNVLGGSDMDNITKAIAKSHKRQEKNNDKKETLGEVRLPFHRMTDRFKQIFGTCLMIVRFI